MAKRIILCFDGTWNEPKSRENDRVNPTNVLKIVRAVSPSDATNCEQVVFYETGISTGGLGSLGEAVSGATGLGISAHIQSGYRFLANNYNQGDEIFVFGFSRGAYAARSMIGLIDSAGLLNKIDMEFVPEAYAYYRTPKKDRHASRHHTLITQLLDSHHPNIKFLGVWDTVGALGVPTPFLGKITKRYVVGFHDTSLSTRVENACHALSIDERRGPFKPSLWERDNGRTRTQQVWFSGVHSNAGGGYPDSGLSDTALEWMMKRACECGLVLDEDFCQTKMQPDSLGKKMDSYSMSYRVLEKLKFPVGIRKIGSTDCSEMIHHSVIDRMMDTRLQYRPENLIGASADFESLMIQVGDHACMDVFGRTLPICQRRETVRRPLGAVTGRLSAEGQPECICELIDFSPKGGMKIKANIELKPGTAVTLESDITGRQQATMVWHDDECMGIKFAA